LTTSIHGSRAAPRPIQKTFRSCVANATRGRAPGDSQPLQYRNAVGRARPTLSTRRSMTYGPEPQSRCSSEGLGPGCLSKRQTPRSCADALSTSDERSRARASERPTQKLGDLECTWVVAKSAFSRPAAELDRSRGQHPSRPSEGAGRLDCRSAYSCPAAFHSARGVEDITSNVRSN
jgi:hypothetical protein